MLTSLIGFQNLIADKLTKDDQGASAVEYGLLVALIAVVIVGAVTLLGTRLSDMFNNIAGNLP